MPPVLATTAPSQPPAEPAQQLTETSAATGAEPGGPPAPAETPAADRADASLAQETDDGEDSPEPETTGPLIGFAIPVGIVEGVDTSDGRYITPNALTWRDAPLTLMATDRAPHGNLPTTDAVHVGRITSLARRDVAGEPDGRGDVYPDGAQALYAAGEFDTREEAQSFARRIYAGQLNGVSGDLGACVAQWEVLEEDEDGYPIAERLVVTAGEVMGFTVVPHPAFAGAYIVGLDDDGQPLPSPAQALADQTDDSEAMAASAWPAWTIHPPEPARIVASAYPARPPAAWFADPHLTELTPVTIEDSGQIWGHLADWMTDHIGAGGARLRAPRMGPGYTYPYYRTGAVSCEDGQLIPTGPITMNTGHASTRPDITAAQAIAHYDNTATGVADVVAGEDAWGIWVAGAMRPGVSEEQVRALRGSALSGDWRRIGGRLHLVAALAVNTPAFPVPRLAVAASGEPLALVAAGGPTLAALGRRRRAGLDPAAQAHLAESRRIAEQAALGSQVALELAARSLRDAVHQRTAA
ncbi:MULTISPECIES: hypothetical protein [Frankia]|uniref:Actinophage protein putative signal peptide n=1 Tax=Frankia alni (strain DSM 45986 / CECT 9034 / ACN14a) TaxID=326424 RepID=Q0RMC1_FRAAA|nr:MULTISPECIES: hypothetical protein [Frankia]CAJ61330.1 putative actinophage protein; putative signal peptide [Frankia alni ACN14a]